jgi:CHAT domain-containing protein
MVTALRDTLRHGTGDWQAPAAALHAALIGPVESLVTGGVVIVPDGPLSALPFAALLDTRGQVLGERATISFAPSLSSLSAKPTPPEAATGALLLGVPRFVEPGVPPLPGSDKEVGAVRSTLEAANRKPMRVLSPATTPAQLQADPGRFDVVHLVSRLRLDGDAPLVSTLLLATAPIFAFDLAVATNLRANVFVLDTPAAPADLPAPIVARGVEGVAAGALAGAARSLILAVTPAEGPAATALLARFYERYAGGESPSVALAGAQREMASGKLAQAVLHMAGADPVADAARFAHPRFWAGFSVWGEP